MNRAATFVRCFAGLVAVTATGAGTPAWAKNPPDTEKSAGAITLSVYNYAQVNRPALLAAESEATRILGQAGVELRWVGCPTPQADRNNYPDCPSAWQENDFVMRVMPKAMVGLQEKTEDTLGSAIGCDSGPCSVAGVYFDRVWSLSGGATAPMPTLLGRVMAHEIGHLLLGPHAHSRTGIMRAFWVDHELSTAATQELVFTAEQSRRMKTRLAEQAQASQAHAKVAGLGRQ
jgi:hypothetical protein